MNTIGQNGQRLSNPFVVQIVDSILHTTRNAKIILQVISIVLLEGISDRTAYLGAEKDVSIEWRNGSRPLLGVIVLELTICGNHCWNNLLIKDRKLEISYIDHSNLSRSI